MSKTFHPTISHSTGAPHLSGILVLCVLFVLLISTQTTATPHHFGTISVTWHDTVAAPLQTRIQTAVSTSVASARTESDFNAALQRLLKIFAAHGYRNARLAPHDFTNRDGRLSFDLAIRPGPISCVVGCAFDGLTHTDTTWLREQLSLPVDVPLTDAWLQQTAARLGRLTNLHIESDPEIVERERTPDGRAVAVTVRWPLREKATTRFDGLLAAGGGSTETVLTGRAALRFSGLFGRDRSVDLRFNRPRPDWRTLEVNLSERGAFGGPLDWTVKLTESRQQDHRQKLGATVSYYLGRTNPWQMSFGASWQRVTPGTAPTLPARTVEAAAGLRKSTFQRQRPHPARHRSELALTAIYSHRSVNQTSTFARSPDVADRLRLETHSDITYRMAQRWEWHLAANGRWWAMGKDRLGPGDEWYLGGPENLRGHDDRSIASASGLWGMLELGHWLQPSLGVSLFGEAAHLIPFDDNSAREFANHMYGYGCAVRLISSQRIGRLEFAWRPQASLRDGIVRLRISQAW